MYELCTSSDIVVKVGESLPWSQPQIKKIWAHSHKIKNYKRIKFNDIN